MHLAEILKLPYQPFFEELQGQNYGSQYVICSVSVSWIKSSVMRTTVMYTQTRVFWEV